MGDGQGLPGRARRGDHRRAGGADPRGGRALRHDTQGRHLLHARHHRAHRRHRQRDEPRQSGHDHRPYRLRERRRQPPARPEQRPGRVRHGRAAQLLPRLPERQRRGRQGEVLQGLRRPHAGRDGPAHPRDDRARRARHAQGDVHHGRGPGAHRRRRQPRAQGAGQPRVPRGPEHLHDRDGQVRRRRPAGGALRGEGRHLHQHRAPRAARAQGGRPAGRAHAPTGRSSRTSASGWGSRWHYDSPEEIFEEIRDRDAAVRRHDLRAHRQGRPAVAVPRRRTTRARPSCTRARSRAARVSCRASPSRRRRSSPTTSTRCSSPPGACCTTTTS